MNWKGCKVLVTGGGGFIGSHLSERLVELGAATRCLVHYNALGSRGWLDASPRRAELEVRVGDIADRDSVLAAVDGVDVVFHLAALIAIPYSYQAPFSYIRTNVEGTANVLQAAREKKVVRIVHTSTSEVYGTAQYVPIDEKHPLQGQSPYSASKIGADKMAEAFHLSFGVPVVTVRPFNTFGPRQSARAIIPAIISQCLVSDRVKVGNVRPLRDFNFVSNIVDGFIKAAEAEHAVGQTFNLGSGREISIADLVALIARFAGRAVTVEGDDRRVRPAGSEVERLLADASGAQAVLDWSPRVSLEDGLQETIAWIKSHLERYRPGDYTV